MRNKETENKLLEYAKTGQVNLLDHMLSKPEVKKSLTYSTPQILVKACEYGQLKAVEYLIHCPHIKPSDQFSFSVVPQALIEACKNGHLEVVRYLIEKTPKNQKINPDDCLKTALLYALPANQVEVVAYILSRPEISPFVDLSFNGNRFLQDCLKNGAWDSVRFLLEPATILAPAATEQIAGVDLADEKIQKILFESVCSHKNTELAIELLNKGYVDQNTSVLLLWATGQNSVRVAQYLIETHVYAQQLDKKDIENAFILALQKGHVEVGQLLLLYPKFELAQNNKIQSYIQESKDRKKEEFQIMFEQSRLSTELSQALQNLKPQFKL